MLGRAGLDERDVRILRGLMSEIDRVESERRLLAGEVDESD
jgi:tRNA C32,U32 (ribose-2'-O)-methylase TrmJ